MLSIYLRSSSISTWHQCHLKYFLEYILSFNFPAHVSAWKGNIVHKATELLAKRKLAEQRGKKSFVEDGKQYQVSKVTTDFALLEAIKIYKEKEPDRKYEESDLLDCSKWWQNYLVDYKHWLPLERDVITCEDAFDCEIDEDWAEYEYVLKGENIKGKLALRGTMDLLFRVDEDTYEYVDIKTGARKDWLTGETKDLEKFRSDMQLLLYYYALKQKYPDKHFIFTTLWLKAGGPFSVCFDHTDIDKLKARLKVVFEEMKQTQKLNNIKGDFKCNFCPFKTQIFKDGVSYCDWFDIETQKMGVDKVTDKYLKKLPQYSEGGGRVHNKTKE